MIGEPAELCIEYDARVDLPSVKLCVEIHSRKTSTAYAFAQTTMSDFLSDAPSSVFSLPKGTGRIKGTFSRLLVGDGAYSCDVELYPGTPGFQFSYQGCYSHYKRLLSFQAVYKHRHYFGRGTITELPFDTIRVEPSS